MSDHLFIEFVPRAGIAGLYRATARKGTAAWHECPLAALAQACKVARFYIASIEGTDLIWKERIA